MSDTIRNIKFSIIKNVLDGAAIEQTFPSGSYYGLRSVLVSIVNKRSLTVTPIYSVARIAGTGYSFSVGSDSTKFLDTVDIDENNYYIVLKNEEVYKKIQYLKSVELLYYDSNFIPAGFEASKERYIIK